MASIHFICKRDGIMHIGVTVEDRKQNKYRSCCWDISAEDAKMLVGGWVYLHSAKTELSDFGGKVIDFDNVVVDGSAHPNRVAFILEAREEGRGQKWRGAMHGMAWTSGLVEADLKHEQITG